jgi:uncharacterized protein
MILFLTLVIVFISVLAQASVGFGLAIISMPLLLLIMDAKIASPVMAVVSVLIAAGVVITSWKSIIWPAALRLLLATLFGLPLGFFLLLHATAAQVKIFLGIVLVGFGAYSLLPFPRPWLQDDKWAFPFGFVAGILGSAFNINGPPTILYGAMRRWDAQRFRATLSGYLVPSSSIIVIGHLVSGFWTRTAWIELLYCLPVSALAFLLGSWINKKIQPEKFSGLLNFLMIGMGVLMLLAAM